MAIYNGKHYDPDSPLCQDDYEWLTETDQYAYTRAAIIRKGLNRLSLMIAHAQEHTYWSLAYARLVAPDSVCVPALETVLDALNERMANVEMRRDLLDAYPRAGYYTRTLDAFLSVITSQAREAVLDWLASPFTWGEILERQPYGEHLRQELAPWGVLRGDGLSLDLDLSHFTWPQKE